MNQMATAELLKISKPDQARGAQTFVVDAAALPCVDEVEIRPLKKIRIRECGDLRPPLPQICGDICYTIAAMSRQFIWEQADWPNLRIEAGLLAGVLSDVTFAQGEIAGALRTLGEADRKGIALDTLADTAIETSQIEGEHLSSDGVRASLARRLALGVNALGKGDPRADGIVAMTVDAQQNADAPLTKERRVCGLDSNGGGGSRHVDTFQSTK